jgi:hypothetical protein
MERNGVERRGMERCEKGARPEEHEWRTNGRERRYGERGASRWYVSQES